MKKVIAFFKGWDYRHYICIGITVAFVCVTVFCFLSSVFRLFDAAESFGTSIAYYFCTLCGFPEAVTPTVTQMPSASVEWFPSSFVEFQADWNAYWQTWARWETVGGYFTSVGILMGNAAKILLIVLPCVLVLVLIFKLFGKKHNNDHAKDSRPLQLFKRLTLFWVPLKAWLAAFFGFIRDNRAYWIIWLCLFALDFNAFSIAAEVISFYLYFCVSFNFGNLYVQVYKLIVDLSVLSRLPFIVWCGVILFALSRWRRTIGYRRLTHREMNNRGFINERPIVTLFVGTMGAKKTTTLTDFALSREVMFKDKAYELLLANDMKFPQFPWIAFEMKLRALMDAHRIYNLASIKAYVRALARCFFLIQSDADTLKAYLRHCRRHRITPDYFIFNYDWQRYGLYYNDGLKVSYLFDVLENYAQEYFIYVITSSLIISNYAIRTDILMQDEGNFPLWNTDFFRRDARLLDSFSRHSHILDFDVLRIGKKVIENNPLAGSFEFGVVVVTEFAKERGNMLTNKKYKADDERANPVNDLLETQLKMFRHAATVDNYPFICFLSDDQRAMSLGADARELFDIVHIRKSSEFRLHMPLFFVEEMLYWLIYPRFQRKYGDYRFRRGDNTLGMHLYKAFVKALKDHYDRVWNTFGYYVLDVQIEDGAVEGVFKDGKVYLSSKKDYSRRFATDCFADYFNARAQAAGVGIEDYVAYETERARRDEMSRQNSYFFASFEKQVGQENNT